MGSFLFTYLFPSHLASEDGVAEPQRVKEKQLTCIHFYYTLSTNPRASTCVSDEVFSYVP